MPHVGQRHRFSAVFQADETSTDPTDVVVSVMDPDGEVTDAAEVNDAGNGLFHVDVDLTKWGPWVIRWAGTGTVPAATETTVVVDRSPFS